MKFKNLLLLILIATSAQSFAQIDLTHIDKYAQQAQKDWSVPGFAIAIVKDGEIIFEKGYGVLEAGKSTTIDENTLFAIASNTKAFIASSIVKLAEEDKLNLQDPVIKHLPYFSLYDAYATNHARVEDLLSHKLGLGTFSGDVIWYKSGFTVPEVIKKIQYIPQAYEFRGGYGYSNMMYITAGEVIRKASGKNWDQYIQDNFLSPLGMTYANNH
jgi:CubicO group peptidase (beta-lactamase class C family)